MILIVYDVFRGVDIEHQDKKGFTPLIMAATAGHDKVTHYQLLLKVIYI